VSDVAYVITEHGYEYIAMKLLNVGLDAVFGISSIALAHEVHLQYCIYVSAKNKNGCSIHEMAGPNNFRQIESTGHSFNIHIYNIYSGC
jgi:hypothetical protein